MKRFTKNASRYRFAAFLSRGGIWVLLQTVLLPCAFGLPYLFRSPNLSEITSLGFTLRAIGMFVIGCGVSLLLAGAIALGRHLTPLPAPGRDVSLVTHGVYRIVRHPIYGGLILIGIGAFLCDLTLARFLGFALLWIFFHCKATVEERFLANVFAEGKYLAYCQRTPRFLPRLPLLIRLCGA